MSIVCVFGMLVGMRLQDSLLRDGYIKAYERDSFEAIYETSEHIKSKYYGNLKKDAYADAIIDDMIEELDPYSHYFKKDRSLQYDRYVNGLFRGIGIEFVTAYDSTYVYSVVPGSQAAKAGIKRKDLIISIDSINIIKGGINVDSLLLSKKIEIGNKVKIKTLSLHNGKAMPVNTFELEVSDLEIPLIEHFVLSDPLANGSVSRPVGYIKIKRFYKGVYRDFMEALELQAQKTSGIEHLIIDLRDNPGGIVDETIKILNQLFQEKEKAILKTVSRVDITKEYISSGRSFLDIKRIVILTNGHSASASEILAGVLQDYDKAVIIGDNTFGKGLIQQNYELSNKGSINLSIGEYVLPTGRKIHSSTSSDSTFLSLTNGRELRSARGVAPDLRTVECQYSEWTSKRISKFLVRHKLWTIEDFSQFTEDLLLVEEIEEKDQCKEDLLNLLKWSIELKNLRSGAESDVNNCDSEIQKAFSIIESAEYLDILGFSDSSNADL